MTTTDPAALYPLMTKAWCWPFRRLRESKKDNGDFCVEFLALVPSGSGWVRLPSMFALAIVRDAAEDWLRGRGWECVHLAYGKGQNYWCKEDWNLKGVESLTAAIEAELGRGEG